MENLIALRLITVLISLYVLYRVVSYVHKVLTNPLNQIPGPYLARWTNIPLKLAVITGRRMHYVDALHHKYGSVVRISPEEVAMSDPKAFQQIHKTGSGFNKTEWYGQLSAFERPTLFTMVDSKQHADRRRLLARGFSKSYLRATWEPLVRSKIELTIKKMKDEGKNGNSIDILKWWTLMATDVSTHLMFGKSFEMIEKGQADLYIRTLQSTLMGAGIALELPLVRYIGRLIPINIFRQMFRSGPFLIEYATRAIRGSRERGDKDNIFAKIIGESEKGEGLDEKDVVLEATGLIVAGSDTTGISLTYLIWAVLSRAALKQALQKELSTLPESYADQDLEDLPLLNAIIDETLRLYGAAPGGLPRRVPAGGANISGYFMPAATTVTTQAYSVHRDDRIYEDASNFDPHRWLKLNEGNISQQQELAKAVNHPFGAGSRICLGIHLAKMELRLGAAEFFRHCKDAKLALSTTESSMEMENFFLIAPRSHQCEIVV